MRALLHRAVVMVSGQGDELATPFAGCTGGCHQGRGVCDCDTELALDIAPDDQRVIQPPAQTSEDLAYIARARRLAIVLAAGAFAILAALLEFFGAREFEL